MAFAALLLSSCGGDNGDANLDEAEPDVVPVEEVSTDPMDNMGIGPISSIELGEIDDALVAEGTTQFDSNCTACHKMGKRYVGPDLVGVTERRSSEWIMNMILNPEGMTAEDPIAKELLAEFSAPMANQNLTEDQARAILEYFRTVLEVEK